MISILEAVVGVVIHFVTCDVSINGYVERSAEFNRSLVILCIEHLVVV